MNWALFACIFAIVVKVWLLWRGGRPLQNSINKPLLVFLLALFVLNITELFALLNVKTGFDALIVLKLYYSALVLSIAALMAMVLHVTGYHWRWVPSVLVAIASSLLAVLLLTPYIVADAQPLQYSITRVAGSHYWIFQLYTGIFLAVSWLWLGWHAFVNTGLSLIAKKRCKVLVLSVTPAILVGLIVLLVMHAGVVTNASIWVSSAISLLLIALVYTETEQGVFGFLSGMPSTREWKLRRHVGHQIDRLTVDVIGSEHGSLKACVHSIECQLVMQTYALCGNDIDITATQLGISSSSVRRKLKG